MFNGHDQRLTLPGVFNQTVISHRGFPNKMYPPGIDSKLTVTGFNLEETPNLEVTFDVFDLFGGYSIISKLPNGSIHCTSGDILLVDGHCFFNETAWGVDLRPNLHKPYTFPLYQDSVSFSFTSNSPDPGFYGFMFNYVITCKSGK